MNIRRVTIDNYRSIDHYEWDLTAPQGAVVQVHGTVGAGKSNLFRAPFWCLTGKEPRKRFKASKVRPRNRAVDKDTSVSVEFSHKGKIYCTTRILNGRVTSVTTFCDGQPVGPVGCDAHQSWMESTFGVNESLLSQTLLFSKGKFENIGYRTPTEMLEYFEVAVGFKFDEAMASLRTELKREDTAVRRHSDALTTCSHRLDDLARHVATLKESFENFDSDQKADNRLIKTQTENAAKFFGQNFEILSKYESEKINNLPDLERQAYALQGQLSVVEKDLHSVRGGVCRTCGRPFTGNAKELEKQAKALGEKLSVLEKDVSDCRRLVRESEACQRTAQEAQNRVQLRTDRKQQLNVQATGLEQRYLTLRAARRNAARWLRGAKRRLGVVEASIKLLPVVRSTLIKNTIDAMNTVFSEYVSQLSDSFIEGFIKPDGTISVKTRHKADHDDLSDGEMTTVDLAWMLAYREVCMSNAGFTDASKLLLIDERLSHLYEPVLVRVLEALRDWSLQTGTQVYIVHHGSLPQHVLDEKLLVTVGSDGVTNFQNQEV